MADYVEEYQEPRERWIHGYFNWTEEEDITAAERHMARDGFDAGANWAERQLLDLYTVYIGPTATSCGVPATSKEDAILRLRAWDYFDPNTLLEISNREMVVNLVPGVKIKVIDDPGIFLT